MKSPLTFFIVLLNLTFFSCTNKSADHNVKAISDTLKESLTSSKDTQVQTKDPRKLGGEKSKEQILIEENIKNISQMNNGLCGYWVGAFGKNKINIAIAYTDDSVAIGHSVCAGNFRKIKGSVKKINDNIYEFNMKEPGDDQYDGSFKFTIDKKIQKLSGTWAPFKNTAAPKKYVLDKKEYMFNDTIGDFPKTSVEFLAITEVQNLLPEEAEMMRNEIYARHGYSFQNLKIRRIFDAKDWYIPMSIDIRDELSDVEAHNIELLYNYENYQEEYYDGFGR